MSSVPGAAADGLMRTPLHHPGLQMGGGSQRHERNGSGYEEPAPKDRTGTHNRERLVDGRLAGLQPPSRRASSHELQAPEIH